MSRVRTLAVVIALLLGIGAVSAVQRVPPRGAIERLEVSGPEPQTSPYSADETNQVTTSHPLDSGSPDGGRSSAGSGDGSSEVLAGSGDPSSGALGSRPASPPASNPSARSAQPIDSPVHAPVAVPSGVSAGSYTLTTTLLGSGTRARVVVDGRRVAEVGLNGEPKVITVPVWLSGPSQRVGVIGVAPPGGAVGEVRVESLRVDPAPAGYTTQGTHILGPTGQPVVPRGVNTFVLASAADGHHFNEPDVAGMASWGTTVVRVQLGQQLLLPGMCEHDPRYLTLLDERVQWITQRGMVAMLDLHRVTQGDPCGDAGGLHEAPDRFSPAFWRIVADRYKDNPLVVFDLFNEPNGISSATWRNGGRVEEPRKIGQPDTSWDAVGMQQLYDTVRATGARNLVYISGTHYATDLRPHVTHPIDGWGIVAAVHLYCDDCGGALPATRDLKVDAAAKQLPVVVTEFGSRDGRATYNTRLIQWAESWGFGWLAHAWAPYPESEYGLLRDWDTHEPSTQGRPVRDALLSQRG